MKNLPAAPKIHLAAGILLLAGLACRPVITIGWGEILLIALIGAVILGPLLVRIIRGAGRKRERENTRDKE